jgi:hypothetical protein
MHSLQGFRAARLLLLLLLSIFVKSFNVEEQRRFTETMASGTLETFLLYTSLVPVKHVYHGRILLRQAHIR